MKYHYLNVLDVATQSI